MISCLGHGIVCKNCHYALVETEELAVKVDVSYTLFYGRISTFGRTAWKLELLLEKEVKANNVDQKVEFKKTINIK